MGKLIVNDLRLNVIISQADRKFQRKYKSNWMLSNEIRYKKYNSILCYEPRVISANTSPNAVHKGDIA